MTVHSSGERAEGGKGEIGGKPEKFGEGIRPGQQKQDFPTARWLTTKGAGKKKIGATSLRREKGRQNDANVDTY